VLDLGVILGHYCSDITRTVYVGRAPKRIRTWYQAVLEAQTAAIAEAKSGAACGTSIGRRGKFWQGTTSTISSFTARATGLDSKCTRIPGWRGAEVAPRAGKRNHN